MEIPEYITKEEVRRVCGELGIRDWTQLAKAEVELGSRDNTNPTTSAAC